MLQQQMCESKFYDFDYEMRMLKLIQHKLKGLTYVKEINREEKGFYEWLFEELDMQPRTRVLDYGTGFGTFWERNEKRLDETMEYHLVDASKMSVKLSQLLKRNIKLDINVSRMDLFSLWYKEQFFDYVVSSGAFLAIKENQYEDALKEIIRVLKPNGMFGVLFESTSDNEVLRDICQTFMPTLKGSHLLKHTIKTPDTLFENLKNVGFNEIEVKEFSFSYSVKDVDMILKLFVNYDSGEFLDQIVCQRLLPSFEKHVSDYVKKNGEIFLNQHFKVAFCKK